MKKRLTESQFQQAIQGLDVGAQTIEIARGVLVDGKSQSDFVAELRLSKGAVSQAVKRVWTAAEAQGAEPPQGYERVTAVLPEHQAFIVRKWAKEAKAKRGQEP